MWKSNTSTAKWTNHSRKKTFFQVSENSDCSDNDDNNNNNSSDSEDDEVDHHLSSTQRRKEDDCEASKNNNDNDDDKENQGNDSLAINQSKPVEEPVPVTASSSSSGRSIEEKEAEAEETSVPVDPLKLMHEKFSIKDDDCRSGNWIFEEPCNLTIQFVNVFNRIIGNPINCMYFR